MNNVPFIVFMRNYINWNAVYWGYLYLLTVVTAMKLFQMIFMPEMFETNLTGLLYGWYGITTIYFSLILLMLFVTYLHKRFYTHGYVPIKRWPQYKALIWKPKDLAEQLDYFKDFPKEDEIIVAAANRALNGDVYAVMRPGRHYHCIALMHEHKASEVYIGGNTADQGFMTNTNRYISRQEAHALALRNGQAKYIHHPSELFSENLWDTPEHMSQPTEIEDEYYGK